jgi:hypothetical protein
MEDYEDFGTSFSSFSMVWGEMLYEREALDEN